jgi:hypothetical protein
MWNSKIYVNDGNPTNIMITHDFNRIGIIDSRGYRMYSDKIEAYSQGLNELYRWICNDWLQCTCEPDVQELIKNHTLMAFVKYKMLKFLDSWKKDLEKSLTNKYMDFYDF